MTTLLDRINAEYIKVNDIWIDKILRDIKFNDVDPLEEQHYYSEIVKYFSKKVEIEEFEVTINIYKAVKEIYTNRQLNMLSVLELPKPRINRNSIASNRSSINSATSKMNIRRRHSI